MDGGVVVFYCCPEPPASIIKGTSTEEEPGLLHGSNAVVVPQDPGDHQCWADGFRHEAEAVPGGEFWSGFSGSGSTDADL